MTRSGRSAISVITTIEVLGWWRHTEQSRRDALDLLAALHEFPLTHEEVTVAVALRSQAPIKLGDAIIAATALTSGLPLMTRNVDDFKRIKGLTIVNPFQP